VLQFFKYLFTPFCNDNWGIRNLAVALLSFWDEWLPLVAVSLQWNDMCRDWGPTPGVPYRRLHDSLGWLCVCDADVADFFAVGQKHSKACPIRHYGVHSMQGQCALCLCVRVHTYCLLSGGNADVVKPDGTDSSSAHDLWTSHSTQSFDSHIQCIRTRLVDLFSLKLTVTWWTSCWTWSVDSQIQYICSFPLNSPNCTWPREWAIERRVWLTHSVYTYKTVVRLFSLP
jgi:hypothetical protein